MRHNWMPLILLLPRGWIENTTGGGSRGLLFKFRLFVWTEQQRSEYFDSQGIREPLSNLVLLL